MTKNTSNYPYSIMALLSALFQPCAAHADTLFPYSVRTKDYSGWTGSTLGDTNTTGMAGATTALPSSISAAEANPAGFAMETGSISAQINRTSITDKRLQPDGESIDGSQWGFAVSPPPWGFSLAYYSPMTESGTYLSPNTGHVLKTEVSLKEFRFTAARALLDDRLAVGLSLEAVKAVRELGEFSYNAFAFSYKIGALYRLQDHVVMGASYSPPLKIDAVDNPIQQNELPGFNRAVLRPSQLTAGVGWVPNRFFKIGASLSYIGSSSDTALLSNESIGLGTQASWIPRLGASYVLAEFSNFKMEFASGLYYVTSRTPGFPDRLHATTGLEANPYFVNLGVGFDLSKDYKNIMIGVGIDLVRTLRTFKIIPSDPTPPLQGYFPRMTQVSADGLPPQMTTGETTLTQPPSVEQVGKIIQEAPKNFSDKISGKPTTVEKREALAKVQEKKRGKKKKHSKARGADGKPMATEVPTENNSGTFNMKSH